MSGRVAVQPKQRRNVLPVCVWPLVCTCVIVGVCMCVRGVCTRICTGSMWTYRYICMCDGCAGCVWVCLFKKNYIHDPWFDKITNTFSSLCLSYSLWLLALSYCSLSPRKTRKRRAYRFLMVMRWKYNYSLCDFWFGLGIYSCTLSWGNRSVCCMDLSQHDA